MLHSFWLTDSRTQSQAKVISLNHNIVDVSVYFWLLRRAASYTQVGVYFITVCYAQAWDRGWHMLLLICLSNRCYGTCWCCFCPSGSCFHSCWIVPVYCDGSRPVLTSASCSCTVVLAQASSFAAIHEKPFPHHMSSSLRASYFQPWSSIHIHRPSRWDTSHPAWRCSWLAIISSVWCSCAILHACHLIALTILLLQYTVALDDSVIWLLGLVHGLHWIYYSLPVVKVICATPRNMSPVLQRAPPTSGIHLCPIISSSPILLLIQPTHPWVTINFFSFILVPHQSYSCTEVMLPSFLHLCTSIGWAIEESIPLK